MSANPITNGGRRRGEAPKTLDLPDWRQFTNDITNENRGHELPKVTQNMDMTTLSALARLPKGWGGPRYDKNGDPIEDSFRAHQVPLPLDQNNLDTLPEFEEWMNSYKPEELFNADGSLKDE
ncbi:hypothetical protein GQS40_01185|uniref:Xylulose 5-phosphate/Fructose 6-phosphate phosphoketolase N-terminal domain-containing protein n=1 Tax=Leuconostoc lactis TaxID=1246 RepID=A0A6L7AAR5_LEULA|nr:hypothetical protein [Leuconostoc lactis]